MRRTANNHIPNNRFQRTSHKVRRPLNRDVGTNGYMKTIMPILLFLCISAFGETPQLNVDNWALHKPDNETNLWSQRIPSISFSNTPLTQAVTTVQQQVSGLTISVASLPDGWPNHEWPITLSAHNMLVSEVLDYLASLSQKGVLYHGKRAILAHQLHSSGVVVPIIIAGRCLDSATGEPLQSVKIERVKYNGMLWPEITNILSTVLADTTGHFQLEIPVVR